MIGNQYTSRWLYAIAKSERNEREKYEMRLKDCPNYKEYFVVVVF